MSSISERADVTLAENYAASRQIRTELASQARNAIGLAKNSFDIGPLTSLQLELAVSALGDETRNVNQVKIAYSDAHLEAMQRAWRALFQSEPIFRSEVSLAFGCGAFIVHKKPFRTPKVTSHSCYNTYEEAVRNVSMGVGLGCTLDLIKYDDASSHRASLRSPSKPSELTVVLTVHHTLMDGESLKLLLDKIDRVAQGFPPLHSASTIDANLALLDIQRTRDLEVRSFFLDYLRNVPSEFTTPEQIPAIGEGSCMQSALFETSVSTAEVASFATRNCASAACIYYVAWAMAIAAIEDCLTVIVGAVMSNRQALHRYDNAMGAYMSTLPLLFNFVDQEVTIAELIRNTMDHLATIGEYAWARSDQVGIGHRMRNLLSIQFPLPDESSKVPALWTESVERNDFPLCLLIESSGDFRMLYNTMQYNEEAIQRLGQHFKHALYSLHHETRVEDCIRLNRLQENLARQADRFRLQPSDRIAKQVLEQAMDRYADLIALEDCIGGKLTYRELDKFTNGIAHFINSTIPNTKVVALYADGTIGWILGLLGAVKAGCTYVNLDPRSTPTQRESICKQCSAEALLLPNASQAAHVPTIDSMEVFALDGILNDITSNKNVGRQPNRASLDSPLVIVFTSGTTGTPKGFPISNRSLMAMKTNYGTTMFASPGRRIAQFMSPVFDVCNMEVFSALLHGATLVLRDPSDPYAHLHRVNTAAVTPSVLAAMNPDYFPNLEVVYACGEPVTAAIVKRYASRLLLYNAYGPAECSILIGIDRLIPGDRITVGRPLKTIRVYVLDEQQQPVPRGARGELCMAGVQVLRDYVNAPEQAARNILSDPWHLGERMYRSGDAGSIGRDGRVNIYGRMDRLVKVRGFRVELAGVELAIVSGPPEENISQCSTIVVNGLVVSFISFDRSQDDHDFDKEGRIARLRRRLCDLLPPSSVPQDIVPLGTFPRTNNGKIDTKALKTLYSNNKKFVSEEESLEETSTSQLGIEQRLAYEWRQVLQLKPEMEIEQSSNFFKMGGHSVSIMLLATRLTTAFGRRITVRELLPSPGFQQQVNIIKQLVKIETTRSNQPEIRSPLMIEELTEIEKQVWFQHQVATTVTAFNIVRVLKIGVWLTLLNCLDH
uniref:Carrier domain-containing protein n=1 Tax=Bionectria ochroleuca TaxID=29856 RepID=A0A8H7K4S4_BIOOC